MKKILTKDNSITFYNPDFKELLHPESGAFKSINQRYLNHIKLKDNMKVLDIGYGIGYISLMILNRVKADITALEYNKECIKNSLILHPKLKTVKILAGDARKNIKKLKINSILITYNSSPIIRVGLIEAGFKLQKYKISKYEEGTIASFTTENLTEEDKRLIRAFGIPFYDPNLNSKKEEILSIQNPGKKINLV